MYGEAVDASRCEHSHPQRFALHRHRAPVRFGRRDPSSGLLFVLHLRQSLVHVTVVPVRHGRSPGLRVGVTGLPASHPAVRGALPPRSRLGSVAGAGDHRDPPATVLLSPLFKLLREWRPFPQDRTLPVDDVDGNDKHKGNGEQDGGGVL